MSLETPLHRAQGLGSSHSGVGHFWKQRATAIALIPLTIWFAISALGLVGTGLVPVLIFLQNPLNAVLMAAFLLISLYHMTLGIREVILDYVPHPGFKFFLMLANYAFALAIAAASVFSLLRIAVGS
jgi:succinate dehydrogenase / fumarate reductase membrane anchor subunit